MCLILFAHRAHPRFELVLLANRDEFSARPTAPMAFWEDHPGVLAGRDLVSGGTWFGLTGDGRFGAITNYRDPASERPDAPSRGALVADFLTGTPPARDYLEALIPRASAYNGFSLILGEAGQLHSFCNRSGSPRVVEPGVHGLSNHLLDTPWPKVERGRRSLAALLAGPDDPDPSSLLRLLEDDAPAPDEELPTTGVGAALERILSPLFIRAAGYGTRSSTLVTVDRDRRVTAIERSWDDGSVREFRLAWP